MLKLIDEIEIALYNGLTRCALGMALTLPDICGIVEFPQYGNDSYKRYKEWCDKYLYNQGFLPSYIIDLDHPEIKGEKSRAISGDMCYKLRCAYLHSGNLELNQRDKDDFPKFELRLTSSEESGIYVGRDSKNKEDKIIKKVLDVRYLTRVLCNAAKEYYDNHRDKDKFKNHRIDILDVEKERSAIEQSIKKFKSIQENKSNLSDYNELSSLAKQIDGLLRADKRKEIVSMMQNDPDVIMAIFELYTGGFVEMNYPK